MKKICGIILTTLSTCFMAASDDTGVFNIGLMNWPIEHSNSIQVARQIESIIDPTPEQLGFLSRFAFLGLSPEHIEVALTALSGTAYVNELPAIELSTNLFIRRLYAVVRSEMTQPLYCQQSYAPEFWIEGSGGSSFFKRDRNSPGCNINDVEITVGGQGYIENWTVGGAFSYQHDKKHFHLGAHSQGNAYMGALYGFYRDPQYYLLVDLIGGYYTGAINRTVSLADIKLFAKGRPEAFNTVLYAEIGKDYLWRGLLIQPFFGVEGGYYNSRRISEKGDTAINLNIHAKSYGTANTRLGLHLSSWDAKYGFEFGFDFSWQCRLVAAQDQRMVAFDTFGESFKVKGFRTDCSSFDGAFSVAKKIDAWTLFIQTEGQVANTWSNYHLMGGINYMW